MTDDPSDERVAEIRRRWSWVPPRYATVLYKAWADIDYLLQRIEELESERD